MAARGERPGPRRCRVEAVYLHRVRASVWVEYRPGMVVLVPGTHLRAAPAGTFVEIVEDGAARDG